MTWFAAGGLFGTYFLRSLLSADVTVRTWQAVAGYPFVMHLPLITFLFLVLLRPAANISRRYYRNISSGNPPFTIVEAFLGFSLGAFLAALLNGTLRFSALTLTDQAAHVMLLWGAAVILFVCAAAVVALLEQNYLTVSVEPSDVLVDSPIVEEKQDTLGRAPFVEGLHRQITLFPSEESFVFGLNGQWGSGKTSVLNLLKNRLEKDPSVILVEFNPWYFSSTGALIHGFYSAVASAINSQFFYPHLPSIAYRYSKVLAPALKKYGIAIARSESSDIQLTKGNVEQYIAQTERRVVVLIDDIDRIQPEELLSVFRTVRLAANFKKTIFVLAYDELQIEVKLKQLGMEKAFLNKIVQNPVQLPMIDQNELDQFLLYSDKHRKSQLDLLFDRLGIGDKRRAEFDKAFVSFYVAHLRTFFGTLRDAKRFLNSVKTSLPVVKDEVHLFDFVLLEVLRVSANKVYQDVWTHRHYFIPAWTMSAIMSSPFGVLGGNGEKQRKIKQHIDSLLAEEPNADAILSILKELFFVEVKGAYEHPVNYDNISDTYRAQKRLTHPESFDKYFLLAVPKGTLPDAVVENALTSWHDALDANTAILETIHAHKEKGTSEEFFDKLAIFLGQLEGSLVEAFIDTISRNIELFSRDGDPSEYDKAYRTLIFALNDRVPDAQKQEVVERVLQETPLIDFAVGLNAELIHSQGTYIYRLKSTVDTSSTTRVVRERFQQEIVERNIDIFQDNSRPGYVLHQIGTYGPSSAEIVNAYTLRLCEANPRYLGRLIAGYFVQWDKETTNFDYGALSSVFDAPRLAELARGAGEAAWTNEKERVAIQRLENAVEQRQRAPPDGER